MSQTAAEYNMAQLTSGALTPEDLVTLVKGFQSENGLKPDGYCGPVTLAELHPNVSPDIDDRGWLNAATKLQSDHSWFGWTLRTKEGKPLGIVAHTTDTAPGTALNMAMRRQKPLSSDPDNRLASWHVTIDTDGLVVQQISLINCAWHAGSTSAKVIPGVGWANYTTVGIELVSPDDKNFPPGQVEAAKKVWRAIVKAYGIPREHAMITHASIDPDRRADPGTEWMTLHAPGVLDYAYGPEGSHA